MSNENKDTKDDKKNEQQKKPETSEPATTLEDKVQEGRQGGKQLLID